MKNKYNKIRSLRISDDVWERFKNLANEEGRFIEKMLEILIENYEKDIYEKEINENVSSAS